MTTPEIHNFTVTDEPAPDDGSPKRPIPREMAYRDHNGSIWVASGGGDAGPRKLYLAGWQHGMPIEQADLASMTTLFAPGEAEPPTDPEAMREAASRLLTAANEAEAGR